MENSGNATNDGERGDNGQDQEEDDRPGIELIEDDDGPMPVPQMPLDDVKESNSKKTVEIIDDDEDDPWSSSILQPRVYQEAIVGEEIAKKGKVLDEHQNRETVDADIDTTVDGDDDMFEEFSWVGYLEPSPSIVTTPPPPSDPAPTENNNNNSILPIGEELNDIEVGRQSAALSNHDEEQSESEPASLLELELEATPVDDTIYDAVAICSQHDSDRDSESEDEDEGSSNSKSSSWWRRNKTYALVGIVSVVIGSMATIIAMLVRGRDNATPVVSVAVDSPSTSTIEPSNDPIHKTSSPTPTESPADIIFTSDCYHLSVNITLDQNPTHTHWEILPQGQSDAILKSLPYDESHQNSAELTYMCLPGGAYDFVIYDENGDGM